MTACHILYTKILILPISRAHMATKGNVERREFLDYLVQG